MKKAIILAITIIVADNLVIAAIVPTSWVVLLMLNALVVVIGIFVTITFLGIVLLLSLLFPLTSLELLLVLGINPSHMVEGFGNLSHTGIGKAMSHGDICGEEN